MTIEESMDYIQCALSGGCYQIGCNNKYRGDCTDEQVTEAVETIRKTVENAEKYKWHDLRKNPDDLPTPMTQVQIYGINYHNVFGCYGTFFTHDGMDRETCWVKSDAWSCNERLKGVIAWRYIEPFEGVEE